MNSISENSYSSWNVVVAGSHHYSAPEVAHSLTSDDRADVWSVGCIGLRMVLTGLRGVDDITSRLDGVKYIASSLSELINLAEEVTLFDCFLGFVIRVEDFCV